MSVEKVKEQSKLRLYNDVWYIRWAIVAIVSLIWPNKPIILFITWTAIDFVMLIFAILTLGCFKGVSGIVVIFEEIFVMIWHLGMLALFFDYKNGSSLSDFWFNMFNYFVVFGYLFSLLLEIFLTLIGFLGEPSGPKEGDVVTEDFEMSEFSEEGDNLDRKIKSYDPTCEGILRSAMREVGKNAWVKDNLKINLGNK